METDFGSNYTQATPENDNTGTYQDNSNSSTRDERNDGEETGALSGLSEKNYTNLRGATTKNPFPESFFSQLFGAENVNYTNIIGSDRIKEINSLRYNQGMQGMSDETGANTGKPYTQNDYYVGQPTTMGEVKGVPSMARDIINFMPAGGILNAITGQPGLPEYSPRYQEIMKEKAKSANETGIINRISNIGTDIGDSLSKTGGAIGKNVNAVSDYIGNMVNKSKSLGSGIFSNSNKEIDKVLSDYKDVEREAALNIAKGSGQFGVPDDRSFDVFGNVKGSSLDTKDEFSSEKDPAGYHTVINPLTGEKQLRYNKNMPYEQRADMRNSGIMNVSNETDPRNIFMNQRRDIPFSGRVLNPTEMNKRMPLRNEFDVGNMEGYNIFDELERLNREEAMYGRAIRENELEV